MGETNIILIIKQWFCSDSVMAESLYCDIIIIIMGHISGIIVSYHIVL